MAPSYVTTASKDPAAAEYVQKLEKGVSWSMFGRKKDAKKSDEVKQ